jgi:hypothetical protein
MGITVNEKVVAATIGRNIVRQNQTNGIWIAEGEGVVLVDNQVSHNGVGAQNYGGIGIGAGAPELRGNVSRDNHGAGIWWKETAAPRIGPGNSSDGTLLAITP